MNGKALYLKRVARWLPPASRDDIVAELSIAIDEFLIAKDLQPEFADTYADITSEFGQPALVATRFIDGKAVIRSGLAQVYWRVLAIALIGVAIGQAVKAFHHPTAGETSVEAIVAAVLGLAGHMFMAVGIVTMTFVVIDGGWRTICRIMGLQRR
jgi:hypothetical protein